MKIGFTDIKKVFVTLPIGYYAFGRVPAVLEQHGFGTCYDPKANKIHIDAEQIEKLCGNIPDDEDPELFIRSCLYHELSHAMLTPKFEKFPYILNVMEDERIETIMKDYFDGVDFFKNITALNGWDGTCDKVPKSPTEAMYQIVRYHMVPPTKDGLKPEHLLRKSYDIISSNSSINANSRIDSYKVKKYVEAIRSFYDDIKMYYPEDESEKENNNENNSEESGNDGQSGDSMQHGANNGQPIGDKDEDWVKSEDERRADERAKAKGIGETATNDGSGTNSEANENRPKKINPRIEQAIEHIVHEMQEIIPEPNSELCQAIDRIFTSFNRKNSGGAAMNCYSGKLNPRNCTREDYRYWEKKAPVNGSNKYGTAHLNLFIDVSGSMVYSIRLVNQLLDALYRAVKTHREVTFSVVAMGEGQRMIDVNREPYLTAAGGNDLTSDIIKQYRDLQKKNTAVYNLVIFDGCAYAYNCESNFSAFNHNNCTIISDSDNQSAIEEYAPSARHIFTDDYAQDFVTGVIKTLETAFR